MQLLPILASLNSIATGQHLFNRSSDLHFSKTLRQHRSYKGELQSFKLSDPERQQLQQKLRHSSELFAQSTGNNEDIFNAIVDSGSSYSATNKFTDAKPDTIRQLEEPLRLEGIAGGLLIEYVGIAEWETLDKNGDIMSFQEQVLIHKDLPNRLLSPQAFLSRDRNGSAVGIVESHCRIYHNRAEWYKDGRHVLTMDFDTSFLP